MMIIVYLNCMLFNCRDAAERKEVWLVTRQKQALQIQDRPTGSHQGLGGRSRTGIRVWWCAACTLELIFLWSILSSIIFLPNFRWVWVSGRRSPAPQIWLMGPQDTLVSFLPTPPLYLMWSCWNWSKPLSVTGLKFSNREGETLVPAPPTKPSSKHSRHHLLCLFANKCTV